jgi:hypothetical protein
MFTQGIFISESTLAHTLTIVIIAATIAWFLFLVTYSVTAKWWKNPVGRNTFGVSFVLFWILFRLMLLRIWPDMEQKDIYGIILYSLAGVFAVQRIVLMLESQYAKNHPVQHNRRIDDPK